MQKSLWAKSDFRGGNPSNDLPKRFRHEMLSLDLLDRFGTVDIANRELLSHLVASHHGHARPLAPICEDDSWPGFRLDEFGCDVVSHEERAGWVPAHRLDSGIAERFWTMNRQFGWWGLAWLEATLRLADWNASADPKRGDLSALSFDLANTPRRQAPQNEQLVLTGIDGSKPLGFLAALGVFRTLGKLTNGSGYKFSWTQTCGAWRPAIFSSDDTSMSEDWLLDALLEHLENEADQFAALRLAELDGPRRRMFHKIADASDAKHRDDADWLSCNGSDARTENEISQLQTSRKDYHPKSVRRLVSETTRSHLQRSLFEQWDYSDPIAGISLHVEPREDRRHAYQWNTPSGDPTAKTGGGMIGANRLALEAWPLFQSLPAAGDRLATVSFDGLKANNTRFTMANLDNANSYQRHRDRTFTSFIATVRLVPRRHRPDRHRARVSLQQNSCWQDAKSHDGIAGNGIGKDKQVEETLFYDASVVVLVLLPVTTAERRATFTTKTTSIGTKPMASERWTSAIAEAASRRHALLDTTAQVTLLRKMLGKRKKAELVDAMVELADNDRAVLRELQMRFDNDGSTEQLIRATRQAIVDATAVDESRINYNFDYDCGAYETIKRNLTLLTEQRKLESAMELSLELMKQGSYQVESSDEGLMTGEIENCIRVVINELKNSQLEQKQVSDWCDAMTVADRVGFICDSELKKLGNS